MPSRTTSRRNSPAAAPISLEAQALREEQQRHDARVAMVRRMASKLRMLDAFMPAIHAAGITLHSDEINCWVGSPLYIQGPLFNAQRNATLEKVLREQGMREAHRQAHHDGSYRVVLQKGRLTVTFSVEAHRLPKPAEAAA